MAEILVRPAVSPDIEILTRFDHTVRTCKVWQMNQNMGEYEINTGFKEAELPREMRIQYPHSPEILFDRWKDFSIVLVGCIDNTPVGYLTMSTLFAPEMVWVKDLVINDAWRRRGIGTTLIQAAADWAKARKFFRMTVEMSSKNYPAISMAKKIGFEFSGFNDNYYMNNDLALFFARYLR
ncbi:MAG: GNAT family N-acetyltransferase [Pelolinea sp.]|nr:GNAT family N-acetyltransferase [Pelolinea sp.]